MLSLLTNYFLHVGTGNESKIASFTEIPFQEEATREVLNTAFCVSASFTELQMEIEKPQSDSDGAKCWSSFFKTLFYVYFTFIRSHISDVF